MNTDKPTEQEKWEVEKWEWLIPSEINMARRYDKWYNDGWNECTKRFVEVIEKIKSKDHS